MKRGQFFRRLITSHWFFAFFPAIIVIFFLPPLGLRYTLQVQEAGKIYSDEVYSDLDSDSITEIIRSGKGYPYYHIIVLDNEHRIYDQWNFKDNLVPDLSDFFFGNYDDDAFTEIYVFTCKGDSVFLNINEFFDPSVSKPERFFITRIKLVNEVVTSVTYPSGFYDLNGDGYKELYFTIATGFGLEPRLYYYFDIKNNVLKSSQFLGVNCQQSQLSDADGDIKPEIFGLMSASGNYKTPIPFTDKSTWFIVMNENLNFEFPPVEFQGLTNLLEIYPYQNEVFRGYILAHNTASADTSVLTPRIMLSSTDGKIIREVPFSDFGFNSYKFVSVIKQKQRDRIFVMSDDLIELNSNLEVINRVKSPFNSTYTLFNEDIDSDGLKEFLLYSSLEEKLAVYNSNLKKLAEAELKSAVPLKRFSYYLSNENIQKLFMTSSENSWFLKMKENRYFYFGFLVYPGIYLSLVIFIWGINRINTNQVQQKERLNQRLLTLQLQGIKSQLDPHFTFNTLNSIASLIYLEDRQAAYDYMNKFTQLLRGMLNDAERIYRSLAEEVEFVTTYLELEKMRFAEKLNYSVEIGDEVDQRTVVPKLVLQTFAENAIKHGLMPSTEPGMLKITIHKEGEYLMFIIEDNGIGREKAAGQSMSTGKGLKLTSEFYDILNQINRKQIKHNIIDLYSVSGDPSGTRVEIWVPVG